MSVICHTGRLSLSVEIAKIGDDISADGVEGHTRVNLRVIGALAVHVAISSIRVGAVEIATSAACDAFTLREPYEVRPWLGSRLRRSSVVDGGVGDFYVDGTTIDVLGHVDAVFLAFWDQEAGDTEAKGEEGEDVGEKHG